MRRRPGQLRRCLAALGGAALICAAAAAVEARDGDEPRGYLAIRGFGSNPATGAHDYWGASLGANYNRFIGGELAVDIFERRLKSDVLDSVGEYGVIALVPQIRLRYPLFDGRLTPYFVAGAGFAYGEFNDRKEGAFGHSVDANRTMFVGTVGGGLEYFISDSVAVGIEVKYLMADNKDVKIDGVRQSNNIDSLLASFGVRMFYPERPSGTPYDPPEPLRRLYAGFRLGGALVTNPDVSSQIHIDPEPPAVWGLNQYFGGTVGLEFARYFAVELGFEGYEVNVDVAGVGAVTEYAVYAVLPQFRFRYPLLDGRLVPYLLAGVGAAFGETNDRKPPGQNVAIRGANDLGLAATIGAGIEYMVTRHVALGMETKYLYTHGLTLRLAGDKAHEANLGPVIFSLGLRLYLADF